MVKKKSVNKELPDTKEGLGISGFVLGVLSIALAGSGGFILAIIGFVFCRIQQKRNPMKLAKIGIILNIIGFVLSIVFLIFTIFIYPLLQKNLAALT